MRIQILARGASHAGLPWGAGLLGQPEVRQAAIVLQGEGAFLAKMLLLFVAKPPIAMPLQNVNVTKSPYLYTGKELQNQQVVAQPLNLMDYGARYYDYELGRWHSVDPLAEKFVSASCYAFCGDNPIGSVDYNGMDHRPWYWNEPTMGEWTAMKEANETYFTSIERIGGDSWGGSASWGDAYANALVGLASYHRWYQITGGNESWSNVASRGYYFGNFVGCNMDPKSGVGVTNIDWTIVAMKIYLEPTGQGGVYDWGRTGNALGAGGIAYGALENAVANKYWWMDARGNYNSTKILSKGANGKFIQGVQGYRNGYNSALNAASKFKVAGNIVGGLGLGVTGLQYYNNQITRFEASVDAAFGVISFFGPIGAGIGATYFIGKLGYEYFSGNTVFEKPQ